MIGHDHVSAVDLESLLEHLDERGIERERAALENDGRHDVKSLRQAAKRLLGHRMERGKRDVLLGGALVDQRLNVGFRENAASPGDAVKGRSPRCVIVELLDRHLQKRGDLVQKRPRAAGAASVHAHVGNPQRAFLEPRLEENHLGILAAELYGHARLGVIRSHGNGVGNNLLYEVHAERFGELLATRTRHRDADGSIAQRISEAFQNLGRGLQLVGMVAHIRRRRNVTGFGIDGACLHRGGTHVDAYEVMCFFISHNGHL